MFLHLVAAAFLLSFDENTASAEYSSQLEFGPMTSQGGDDVMFNLIDGEDADIQRFPFYAMLVKRESALNTINTGAKLKLFCGSSLIHPRFILTAFHCFKKRPYPEAWVAIFNVVDRCHPVGFRGVEIVSIFFHKGSTASARAKINDIALAQLKFPIVDIVPVNLPRLPPVVGRVGMLVGFGRVELKKKKTDAEVPCILKKTSQLIELPARCRHVHQKVVHAFCTTSMWRPSSMACRGDSGGPWLVSGPQGYEVQGLSSFGAANCKPIAENDHYTNVYVFRKWIAKIITGEMQKFTNCTMNEGQDFDETTYNNSDE